MLNRAISDYISEHVIPECSCPRPDDWEGNQSNTSSESANKKCIPCNKFPDSANQGILKQPQYNNAFTEVRKPKGQFKATERIKMEFKPSKLVIADEGPVKLRMIARINAKPKPVSNDVKSNKSYKLRYDYIRKQGAVPPHLQKHFEKYKKLPFKRVWVPEQCFDNIVDRAHATPGFKRCRTGSRQAESSNPVDASKRSLRKSIAEREEKALDLLSLSRE